MLIQTFFGIKMINFSSEEKGKVSGATNDHMCCGLLVTSGSNQMILRKSLLGRC